MKWMIFGFSGQDGSYISELLLEQGEEVCGIVRRSSLPNDQRIKHLDKYEKEGKLTSLYADLLDDISIRRAINKYNPDVIINLGAQSHVGISFDNPISTIEYNALGPMRILEAIKDINPKIKFYQASSSEMWGISPPPQDEDTKMQPVSPYGIAKTCAYFITRMYRNAHGLHATNGILHNHESSRRGFNFVTRKITMGISKIVKGEETKLVLGNLDAKRDWGHSKEYMGAVIEIMKLDKPVDILLATEETHTIRDFLKETFSLLGLNWEDYVEISDNYKRPYEVPALLGNPKRIKELIGWEAKTKFTELAKEMLEADLKEICGLTLEEAKKKMERR
jgi:GDPmannose 4,6-dehydratase